MTWDELQLVVPRQKLDVASAALWSAGAAGVQEDFLPGEAPPPRQPWDTGPLPPLPPRALLRAWLEDADRPRVETAIARFGEPRWSDVPDVDWGSAWRTGFDPVTVGAVTVTTPWDPAPPPGAVVIEPGQGFGTGQHPTTRLALAAVAELVPACATVLDVGSGSGILSLVAVRLGARARGVDVDASANRDALANAARNGLAIPFDNTPVADLSGTWELVVANVYAEELVAIAPDLLRLTGQRLVLTGILADREPLVREAFASLELDRRDVDGEWVCLWLRR